MRLLRVLALARVAARLLRDRLRAVQRGGLLAGRGDGLLRQGRRVRSHVGDVAVLVERLGHAHGLARGEPELARGLLLQRRRREGRGGSTRVRLRLDAAHDRVAGALEHGGQGGGGRLVETDGLALERTAVVEVASGGDPRALQAGEPRREGGVADLLEAGGQVPVVRGDEGEPLALTVDDETGRRGLHATRRESGADLAPEHRRDLVPVETVEDAAGLLRVDQRGVELAGGLLRALDGLLGDLVEHHALDRHLGLEHLQEVPRDGLALAVLIGCEEELVGFLQRPLELGDRLLLRVGDDVVGLEAVVDVDRELAERTLLELGGQVLGLDEVTDVSDGRLDLVSVTEVLRDRLRLRGALDDHELLRAWHVSP